LIYEKEYLVKIKKNLSGFYTQYFNTHKTKDMKKKIYCRKILLGFYLLIAGMSIFGQAKIVYIDPSATVNGTGTQESPLNGTTFQIQYGQPWKCNTTYLFKRGTKFNQSYSFNLTDANNSSNITLGAYGTGARPIIQALSTGTIINIGGSNVIVGNITIDNLELIGNPSTFSTNGSGVAIANRYGFVNVTNCKIHGVFQGVRTTTCPNLRFIVTNCKIYNIWSDGGFFQGGAGVALHYFEAGYDTLYDVNMSMPNYPNDGDGFHILDTDSVWVHNCFIDHSSTGTKFCVIYNQVNLTGNASVLIEKNHFIYNSTGTIHYITLKKGGTAVFRYNLCENAGLAIQSRGFDYQIYYNIFRNISIIYQLNAVTNSTINFYNNVVYHTNTFFDQFGETINCYNNIIDGVALKLYNNYGQTPSRFNSDNNCYLGVADKGVVTYGVHDLRTNPLFRDTTKFDFTLKSNSPCIDAGKNLGNETDFASLSVPYGNNTDIGAYEYNSSTPPPVNKPPVIGITSPDSSSTYIAPASILITVSTSDADGTISKVEFFNGSTKLGESITSPYSFIWGNVAAGTYSLTAVATDNSNAKTTSKTVSIVVKAPNNILPSVGIVTPTNNSTFIALANIAITASASDIDGKISKVEFFNGSTKLGESLTSPYSFTWSNVAAGTYYLTAVATDNLGAKTTSSQVMLIVNNNIQSTGAIFYRSIIYGGTSITLAPGNYTSTQLAALGMDDNSISSIATNGYEVIAYKDNNFSGTPLILTSNQPNLINIGWNDQISSIKVVNINSSANMPPVVSLTSPGNGQNFTTPANVAISANATDADGTISKVEFYNGSTKIGESFNAPYSMSWTNVPFGTYKLTAVATDNLNAITTSTVKTIYVNNSKSAENNDSITGIANTNDKEVSLKVFPNPNNGVFSVSISNQSVNDKALVRITDLTGKTLFSSGPLNMERPKEFDITKYKQGIYIVTVIYNYNKILNQKIIKN
jgi:hypothetical protein